MALAEAEDKARLEAEAAELEAKALAEAEEKAKLEADAAEAEAKALAEAEEKAKLEAEAAEAEAEALAVTAKLIAEAEEKTKLEQAAEIEVQAEALEKVTLEVEKALPSDSDDDFENKAIAPTNGVNGHDED